MLVFLYALVVGLIEISTHKLSGIWQARTILTLGGILGFILLWVSAPTILTKPLYIILCVLLCIWHAKRVRFRRRLPAEMSEVSLGHLLMSVLFGALAIGEFFFSAVLIL